VAQAPRQDSHQQRGQDAESCVSGVTELPIFKG
jgi:hypothetical protein